MSIDSTGPLITFMASGPNVIATGAPVAGQKIPKREPPYYIVRRSFSTRAISGPGSDRTGVQKVRYIVLCYGRKATAKEGDLRVGYREAYALAGALSEDIHQQGPMTVPAPGGSGRLGFYKLMEDSIGDALIDPQTEEPFVPVILSLIATATALA